LSRTEKVYIIGVGEDGLAGLSDRARRLVEDAELLIGEAQTLALVPEGGHQRLRVGSNLDEVIQRIEAQPQSRTVVLTAGDPLFYGVARYLCDRLGKDRFEVMPHVSAMQTAFARVKESWEEAFLTNLASHGVGQVLEQIRGAEKVGLFTSEETPPAAVASYLLDQGVDNFTAYVCENLGSPDERVTQGELAEIAGHEFSPLNVMVLIRKPHTPDRPRELAGHRLFGNPDDLFLQSKPRRGLLTPSELRAMALAQLDLGPASVVWDIGAGSGSVAVEAAQIAAAGEVYAIEMDPEEHQLIVENARRFEVKNLKPILGRAPEAWGPLPDPDAVFIGNSGLRISLLVDAAYQRLRRGGRLVVTMGSIDNVAEVHQLLRAYSTGVKAWMLNLARGNFQFDRLRFESIPPTFMVAIVKPN
jgi:precorrin-6Y C5,15-methyltransferase (decarboxylating)